MSSLSKIDLSNQQEINKGYSPEKKYKVLGDKAYFLKASPLSFTERKQLELKYLSDRSNKSLKRARLLEVAFQENRILSLYDWIDGEDFRDVAEKLTPQELYQYGIRAGQMLKIIHDISIDEERPDWARHYNTKIERKIEAFNEVKDLYPDGNIFMDFIEKQRHLLDNRPQTLCHGD